MTVLIRNFIAIIKLPISSSPCFQFGKTNWVQFKCKISVGNKFTSKKLLKIEFTNLFIIQFDIIFHHSLEISEFNNKSLCLPTVTST